MAKPVTAVISHHTASFNVPGAQADHPAVQTSQVEPSALAKQVPQATSTPKMLHEIRLSQWITGSQDAETTEVPKVRKIITACKTGIPLADEETIRTIKVARSTKETKLEKTAIQVRRGKAIKKAVIPTSSTRGTAASKPGTHRDSSTGPAPARPTHRRTGPRVLGRIAVLSVLAVVMALVPLSSHLDGTPLASAVMKIYSSGSATQSPTADGTRASSVAGVMSGDDDLDEDSDTQLFNMPDVATRARIREAFRNAIKTCSLVTGAPGGITAFSSKSQLLHPMPPGTHEISPEYGYRTHPTLGYRELYAGQDMVVPVGTPIYTTAIDTVTTVGMVDETGIITIKHEVNGQVRYTGYLHIYKDGIRVKVGDTIAANQMIVGVSNTGRSSGSYLHLEVRTKDDTVDEPTVEPWGRLKQHNTVELTTNCD